MYPISSSEIINVVAPESRIFLSVPAFAAVNGISTFLINGKPTFSNDPTSQGKNPSDCIVLDSLVFDNFVLKTDKLFAKALRKFVTYLSVSNSLCGKLSKKFRFHLFLLILIYQLVKLITL